MLFLAFASYTFGQEEEVEPGEGEAKACRLTVTDSSTAVTQCIGLGMVCNTITDCFEIFKPVQN